MRLNFKNRKSQIGFFEWDTKTTTRLVVIVCDSRRWG